MLQCNLKKNYSRIAVLVLCILLCFIWLAEFFPAVSVRADETQYSDVLADLQVDSTFDLSEWDNVLKHPQTELAQISESTDHELYLYVHFVGEIKPVSKVVFNTQTSFEKLDFRSYDLQCVSENGSFCKYLVNGYKTTASNHIYAITRLEYPVHKKVSETQVTTYEYISVEQYWTVSYDSDKVSYKQEHLETIEVTDKYLGSHNDGEDSFWGYKNWTDTFYYAFSTEIDMDDLLEVQIEYQMCLAAHSGGSWEEPYTDIINCVIYADDSVEFTENLRDHWWFFEWNVGVNHREFKAIETPEEFREHSGLSLPKNKFGNEFDWVVTFYNKREVFDSPRVISLFDVPANTSILRLKYIKDGVTYNVGVLDTRSTYINPKPKEKDYWWILYLVLAVILLLICMPILPTIMSFFAWGLKGLFTVVKWLIKGLFLLITLPFRLIIALFAGGGKK